MKIYQDLELTIIMIGIQKEKGGLLLQDQTQQDIIVHLVQLLISRILARERLLSQWVEIIDNLIIVNSVLVQATIIPIILGTKEY